MQFRVTLFGKLSDLIGREGVIEREAGSFTVADLRRALADEHPGAATDLLSPRVRAVVNDSIVGDDRLVEAGDEVALLPPVSGG